MKKILCIILASVMLLASCNDSNYYDHAADKLFEAAEECMNG